MARSTSSVKKKKRRGGSVSVDFTGVEASSRTCEDGTYTATVQSVEETESQEGNPNLSWKWKIKTKKDNGAIIFDNTSLQPQSLWRLRLLLEAIGEEIPDGEMDLTLEDYVGREAKVEITNEKWEGKNRPRITGFVSVDQEGEEDDKDDDKDDDEEDEKPKRSKKPSKDDDDDDDDDDKDEKDDDDEEDEKPKKKPKKPADDDDDDDDKDEEDDEEDEKPSKSKFKVGTKVKFKDENNKTIKGVIVKLDGKTAQVEDGEDEEWEVETSDLTIIS